MPEPSPIDIELTLQTLNYATRLLASQLDEEVLVDRALDTLSDFGRSGRVALLTVEAELGTVEVAGRLSRGTLVDFDRRIPYAGTPLEQVIRTRRPAWFAAEQNETVPLPCGSPIEDCSICLCLPLIGRHNQVLGIVTLERPPDDPLSDYDMQVLNVLGTLIAVSMENARLFYLATVDGLTGLYVRRYFEIRLNEELARLKRHGGTLAVMMTDIDRFKQFNDTYGHQAGDALLRGLADLVKATVRKDLDIVCRYGGEEYVIILPSTDLAAAHALAERLRERAEEQEFPSPAGPLRITLSAGVSAIDALQPVEADELVRRADMALYEAKEGGRNQVRAWREDTAGEPKHSAS